MNWTEPEYQLRFESGTQSHSRRLAFTGICLLVFTLMWLIVPGAILYWLLLVPIGILAWAASFAWRPVLGILHEEIHHLEEQ